MTDDPRPSGPHARGQGPEVGSAEPARERPLVLGYVRDWVHHSDPGVEGYGQSDAAAVLRALAMARGLRVAVVHEDTPGGGTRRPGLAALVRDVAMGADPLVLVPDGRHLSSSPEGRTALVGLLTDLGAQVVLLAAAAADDGRAEAKGEGEGCDHALG